MKKYCVKIYYCGFGIEGTVISGNFETEVVSKEAAYTFIFAVLRLIRPMIHDSAKKDIAAVRHDLRVQVKQKGYMSKWVASSEITHIPFRIETLVFPKKN